MRRLRFFAFVFLLLGAACGNAATATPTKFAVVVSTRTPVPTAPITPARANPPTATSTPRPAFTPTSSAATVDQLLARCPTAPEVAAIDRELKLSFEADLTAPALVCAKSKGSADLTLMQRRVYQTLQVMKQLRFSKPLPWTSKSLYEWFTGVIDGIRFRSDIDNSYCCSPSSTINIKVAPNMHYTLTDRWVDPKLKGGLMDLVGLLVHEARHRPVEGGRAHSCGSNDKTIAELGAWGVQYYLDVWLAEYADPDFLGESLYRETAKDHAEDLRQTRFCDEPKN